MSEAPSTPAKSDSGGRTGDTGRGGHNRNRNKNRSGRGGSHSPGSETKPDTSFVGNTEDMNGHVFQCFNESANPNQFEKTVEVLGEYAAKNFKHASDLELLFRNLSMPPVEQPTELNEKTSTKADIKVYDKELDIYVVRKTKLKDNVKALYAVAWGQCSNAMKAKIKKSDKYEEGRNASNVSWLLKEIRGVTFGFENQRTLSLSLQLAQQDFYRFKQGSEMSMPMFYQTFKNKVAVLEHYSVGDTFGQDASLRQAIRDTIQSFQSFDW
jgi:hypothetical protein